jgi:superfamily I DNA/RNA helicase
VLIAENNHAIRNRIESVLLDFQKDPLLADLKLTFPTTRITALRRRLQEFSAGWATQPHDNVFEEDDDRRRFKAAVVDWLAEHEAAMMEEIVYHAVALVRQLGATRRYPRYILVDEVQDLNRLEQEFLDLVAADANLLVVVGDPDQSIYSFKFAHPTGILDFSRRPGVEVHQSLVTGRCPRSVITYANRLLLQAAPARQDLIQPLPTAIDGEVRFVRRDNQNQEFDFVLESIARRLHTGTVASDIVVLTPRRKLSAEFATYASFHKTRVGIPDQIAITSVQKDQPTAVERERLMLFGLVARRGSLLHARTYVGLPDNRHYATELRELKERYGSLRTVLDNARADDMPRQALRLRRVCARVEELRRFLQQTPDGRPLDALLDELCPGNRPETASLRAVLDALREDGDTATSLYSKYIDYTRTVPSPDATVRVMTLMASKGLEAQHVFIVGCNNGNIPGHNRSAHLADNEHRQEQLRLLYVGFTRATRSLTVTWSREIPFHQARGHNTPAVRTIRRGAEVFAVVGLSDFLQDLNATWDT